MALADVLNNLAGARDALVTAINNKGGTVAASATLRQCAAAVTALPEGGGGVVEIPGQIFHASFAEDSAYAESGQPLVKIGTLVFGTVDGIPCVRLGEGGFQVDYPLFSGNKPFTISYWGKCVTENDPGPLTVYQGQPGAYKVVFLNHNGGNFGASNGNVIFMTEVAEKLIFHHFLFIYDQKKYLFFVDGNQIGESSSQFSLNIYRENFYIGYDAQSINKNQFYLANMRIFTRVLSADEISTLYDEFVNRDNPSGGGSSGGGATSADLVDLIERDIAGIEIPEGTTEIGYGAFSQCASLNSVSIPEGVTKISQYAFLECTSLTSVVIPRSVTTIESDAFASCFALDSLIILPGVTNIGSGAFSGCTSLTSVVIPNSVTEIGSSAFAGCRLLASVTIPDSVLSIGNFAFNDCDSLTDIYCGFAENVVPGAPWGAPETTTIHYNA